MYLSKRPAVDLGTTNASWVRASALALIGSGQEYGKSREPEVNPGDERNS
jgi:hypothetical protein